MEEHRKKFWLLILVCVVGLALLLSALKGYPDGSPTHAVLKFSGLFLLAVGASVLVVEFMWYGKFQMPVSASIWLAVNGAEKIKLESDFDRAKLEDILRDIKEYKEKNNFSYPPILQSRITALECKLNAK